MRRLSPAIVTVGMFLFLVTPAIAHPLGNFTINHYTAIESRADGLSIEWVLDMAEIPTFQEVRQRDAVDLERYEADLRRRLDRRVLEWIGMLHLTADGVAVPLTFTGARISCLPGAGNLPVLRVEADLWAAGDTVRTTISRVDQPVRFVYRDTSFPDRAGWKEIVVMGQNMRSSSVPAVDRGSNRLRSYPADASKAPPGDVEARFSLSLDGSLERRVITPAPGPSVAFDLSACRPSAQALVAKAGTPPEGPRPAGESSAFGALFRRLSEGPPNLRVLAIALAGAFVLGAYHAASPGHGKTILAAYFIGSRGTPGQAVLLGTVTTLTHTTGVFLLGFATLIAVRYIRPEELYPWLGVSSGLLLMSVGLSLLRRRLAKLKHRAVHHAHHLGHAHHHLPPAGEASRTRDLIMLGITGGIIPCPSALVVMLAAISVGQVGFGLILITAFSVGLAAVLIAGGLLMIYSQGFMIAWMERTSGPRAPALWRRFLTPMLHRLPVFSAAAVAVLGLAIVVRTIASSGFIR